MEQPIRIYLKDHAPPPFLVPRAVLEFDFDMERTVVTGTLQLAENLEAPDFDGRIVLNGEGLDVLHVALNGLTMATEAFDYDGRFLIIKDIQLPATITTKVAVNVAGNSSKIGLNPSEDGDIFSQCEAEGMRKFTFMLDRPDILAEYEVTMRADKSAYPVLLANGHKIASGDLPDGRHWARWHDPIPKSSFIFCVVAGRLAHVARSYETRSGRLIEVGLYAPQHHLKGCLAALDFVFAAMRWDEDVFGREYDLSVFNICVLNGFLGAMENKGLNLFDLAWAVAHPSNTTDDEYEYRLKSVGHEYFHNWSGDRVTIANWFQTTLKEGLTRFRDQLFLGDMTEFSAVRVRMAQHIRGNQFTEDDSGIAHPPVLESYIDTRNNYTVTIYDKGQEIIFMLLNLVGRPMFERVVASFFDRYATQAVTVEEFLETFEELAGLDLQQFRRWYYQGGLTSVTAQDSYDAASRQYYLTLSQRTIPTPDQPEKQPHHIPLAMGLLSADGKALPTRLSGEDQSLAGTRVLQLRDRTATFVFEDVPEAPVLSILRGFSAPVVMHTGHEAADLAVLIAHDADPFARWDAVQRYVTRLVTDFAAARKQGQSFAIEPLFARTIDLALQDAEVSGRMIAEFLTMPDERTLGEQGDEIDVDGVHHGREAVMDAIASAAENTFWTLYERHKRTDPVSRDNAVVGARKVKLKALEYLARLDDDAARRICLDITASGENFTEQVAALSILAEIGGAECEEALAAFNKRHAGDQLAMDHWYRVQIIAKCDYTAGKVEAMMDDPAFNPVFSRMFTFCDQFFYRNRYGLHAPGGAGYGVFQRQMLKLDRNVPMLAGWTIQRSDFTRWWKFDETRRPQMRSVLQAMLESPDLGEACFEVCSNAIEAGDEILNK